MGDPQFFGGKLMGLRGNGGSARGAAPDEIVLAEGRAAFGWRWQLTSTHLRTGRLGSPVWRGAREVPLVEIGSVQIANGAGRLRQELHVSAGEGRMDGGHRGAVIAYLDDPVAADRRIVLGTATVQEAKDLGRLLAGQVDGERRRAGQPPRPVPADRAKAR